MPIALIAGRGPQYFRLNRATPMPKLGLRSMIAVTFLAREPWDLLWLQSSEAGEYYSGQVG